MDGRENADGRGTTSGTLAGGAVVTALAVFDAIVFGLPVFLLAVWFNALIVFVVALAVLIVVNVAACTWVDRKWDAWVVGTRFEAKMQKVRDGKRARRPIEWMNRGSDLWFALAAALLNAIQVTALARLITGQPAGERRILIASVAYSLYVAGIFSLLGFALGDGIRAL